MIFSKALGELDLDGVFDEYVTIEDFLHKKGGEVLENAEFYVFMDTKVSDEEFKIAEGLRADVDRYHMESFVKQAKIKHIEEELKDVVATSFIEEINSTLEAWVGDTIGLYLGDETGKELIKFSEVLDGELNEVAYNNYKQHIGRVVKNKRKMYVDFADAKEFTHLYLDIDHRKLKVMEEPMNEGELNFKTMSKKEFIEAVEDNMLPYSYSKEIACYDLLEQSAARVIEDLEEESSLWIQYYTDIVDKFDFKEEEEKRENEDLPTALMEPMEQLAMVAA